MPPTKKLPLGVQTFRKIIEGGYYYVDKTGLACDLIEQGSYYFLSRPRRFGKSLFLDTLKSIFAGEKALFTGLAAEQRIDWSQSWPIIRLNFAYAPENSLATWQRVCLQQMQAVEKQYGVTCSETHPGLRLGELIGALHQHTGRKVVVLVDEYDKPILDNLENPDLARTMRDFLAGLYTPLKSEDEHLHFVMLSGVSKFSKVSLFSGLNHLTDITLHARYSSICGYTEPELTTVFADRLAAFSLDEVRRWYNGYHWLGAAVYNPWSLLNLFESGEFGGHWWRSGQPGFLLNLLKRKHFFLPRLSSLYTNDDLLGKFDVDDISPEALLFQSGYLTIRQVERTGIGTRYLLGYPNMEIETHLNAGMFATLGGQMGQAFSELSGALARLDWPQTSSLMHAQFAAIPYHYHTQNPMAEKEGWYASLFFSMLGALGFHIVGEDVTNHGRIDLTLMLPQAICLFEFKVGPADKAGKVDNNAALAQIAKRAYAQKYAADGRPVLAVGVTFAPEARNIVSFAVRQVDGGVCEYLNPPSAVVAPQAVPQTVQQLRRKNPDGINLLHLTDLHFGWDGDNPTQKAQRESCLHGLLSVLRALPMADKPDAILISGDIGWRGAETDYAAAHAWLALLASACELDFSRIVVAPGNHDSVRKQARQLGTPEDATDADEMLQPPLGEMLRRTAFAPFARFAEQAGMPALTLGQETTRLAGMAVLPEVLGVRVLVLNSAWCARGDDDKGQLWLGLPQLTVMATAGQIGEIAQGAPLTVAVMHHPFDWLHDEENHAASNRVNTKDWLAARCHVLLTGHTHAEVRKPDQIAGGCFHFTAGASYAGAEHFNSFRMLHIAGNQCHYRTWEFSPRKASDAWTEQQQGTVTLPHLGKAEPPAPAQVLAGESAGQAAVTMPVKAEVSRLLAYAPARLLGREGELARLRDAWAQAGQNTGAPPIVAIIALGGEGKTSLLSTWMQEMQTHGWHGAQAVFAWSFYSQGSTEQSASSSDMFLAEALTFFGETELAASNHAAYEKGKKLAECCARQRTLLLLDGLEPLQYAPTAPTRGELRDQGMLGLLRGLGAHTGPGVGSLCVLTSRYALPQIENHCQTIKLPRLPTDAAIALLRAACPIGAEADYAKAVEEVKGHALALHILAQYVKEAHNGDIRQRDLVDWNDADTEETHGHAFRAMAAYGQWLAQDESNHGGHALALLHVLGLFDRPAERRLVQALLQTEPPIARLATLHGLAEQDWNICINRLAEAGLLSRNPTSGPWHSLDVHPLLREYFAKHWQEQDAAGFRAAHKCLFEFLQANTKEGDKPSLADLLPLYQAVAHGCWAREVQAALDNVYWRRIVRRDEAYSSTKLGAYAQNLAAIACFFTQPWQQVAPGLSEAAQAWLLNEAAFSLRALGRLPEAVPAMQAALAMQVAQQNWEYASVQANNLAELHLLLGQIAAARSSAQQALAYADQSGDAFWRMASRTTLADAQHQAGQMAAALALMQEAERMQAERQPEYPLLYSVPGFRYCELLQAGGSASAQQVAERARQTLVWAAEQDLLLDIALGHLSLARCALQQALPAAQAEGVAEAEAEQAVAGLRQSGDSDFLPRALLTRAAVLCPTDPFAAIADLNESHELCQRGPMPLFMADTLLTRVRLFAPLAPLTIAYPWQSPQADLQEARRIIDQCGYERRRPELEALQATLPSTTPIV